MKRVAAPKRERKNDFEIWRDAFERRVMKDTELLPQYRLVLLALAKFLNRKTRNAFPRQRVLGEMCGVTRFTANRAIAAGRARGHISKRLFKRLGKKPLLTYAPALHPEEVCTAGAQGGVHALCTHEPLKGEPLIKDIPPSAVASTGVSAKGEIEAVRKGSTSKTSPPRLPPSGELERAAYVQGVILARGGFGRRVDVVEIVRECHAAGVLLEAFDVVGMARAGYLRRDRQHCWVDETCRQTEAA